ncbi:cob(I)yrinic acid a,c-diamide adenosyltransferase, partial [Sphingopyxis sp.]|uniref:cob(I)yrinic acid a,c-diamide adenosyltransferase n=1 Tax=Sphingopyxis sp. TaxID=1908224 RepID=UPI002B494BD6
MVKLNKIYTRTGDDGTTGLVDGSRIAKSDALMAAIGDVDEANSWIGLAAAALDPASDEAAMLARIQNEMFDLGADLATPPDIQFGFGPHEMALRIVPSQIARLEDEIDAMNAALDALKSFILPGGTEAAAQLHVARAVTRRAER